MVSIAQGICKECRGHTRTRRRRYNRAMDKPAPSVPWLAICAVVLIAFGLLLVTGNVDVLSAHISRWLQDLHLGRLSTS